MLAKPLAVTSAHPYYIHILIVRIPLGKLSCWLSRPVVARIQYMSCFVAIGIEVHTHLQDH